MQRRLQRRLYGIWKSVFMHSEFLVDQNWLISVLINLVNHQITQLNAKKN